MEQSEQQQQQKQGKPRRAYRPRRPREEHRFPRIGGTGLPAEARSNLAKEGTPTAPAGAGVLRIIPLGGLGEIGRNMMVLEYERQILIMDMGFRMPEEDMPGIDYIIPNIEYFKGREKDILGVFITHAHYDHIGAMPFILPRIGNPTVYTGEISRAIIQKREEDFPNQAKSNIVILQDKKPVRVGPFLVEPFRQTHSITNNFGFFIKTPAGNIVNTSDFKFDTNPVNEPPSDFENIRRIGNEGVTLLMCDSTNAEQQGHSLSEVVIMENLEEIFKRSKGRIIAATFASLLNRVQQIITLSEKYGRKVSLEGYSMKSNVEILRSMGQLKAEKHTILKTKELLSYPEEQMTVLCTGAQGEENAVLMRMVNGEHPSLKIHKGDAVVFSSSVIPGNERTVQFVKDHLYRQGAEVYHYKMMDIHASGHGNHDELLRMTELIRPQFFMPLHGQYSMMIANAKIAKEAGMAEKNIQIVENGQVAALTPDSFTLTKETVPSNYVMVDGLGIGDVGEIVLRDRQNLSKDGMFVIIAIVDKQTGRVKGSPDIISRGFIYLRESKDLLRLVRRKSIEIVEKSAGSEGAVNWAYVKENIRNKIGDFLFAKTERRPMVIPVVIEV
ncbi:MAG: ribonuclease J [Candidatus Wildermuthbacteria bacterium]|nr:ribonuclease J [Candidatus Wildermuthbacteria bacterium]